MTESVSKRRGEEEEEGGQAVRGGGTASVPLCAVGGGESRREGRGHTAVLYSHRYRGGFSIAFLQRWETEGEKGGGGGASYFSDTESACECDACVDRVGRACS